MSGFTNLNIYSDLKRKKNGCDLRDFQRFDGLSVEELKTHLSNLESHLVRVQQKILEILTKTIKADRPRVEEIGVGTSNPKPKPDDLEKSVLEVNNLKVVSDNNLDNKLGFGGVFDELGYVVRGSATLDARVSDYEPKTLVVPKDDAAIGMEAQDYNTPLDPLLTLGFETHQLYPIPDTYDNLPMGIWDMDLFSTLASDYFMMTSLPLIIGAMFKVSRHNNRLCVNHFNDFEVINVCFCKD